MHVRALYECPGKGGYMASGTEPSLRLGHDTSVAQKAWYLIYTKPRQEMIAAEHLTRQRFLIFLPLLAAKKPSTAGGEVRKAPLFPRYLFIHLAANADNWAPIRSTVGVSHLVRFGKELARVPAELIEALCERCTGSDDRCLIDRAGLQLGDKVRISGGVAKDFEGIVTARSGRDRVELLLKTAAAYSARVQIQEKYLERLG